MSIAAPAYAQSANCTPNIELGGHAFHDWGQYKGAEGATTDQGFFFWFNTSASGFPPGSTITSYTIDLEVEERLDDTPEHQLASGAFSPTSSLLSNGPSGYNCAPGTSCNLNEFYNDTYLGYPYSSEKYPQGTHEFFYNGAPRRTSDMWRPGTGSASVDIISTGVAPIHDTPTASGKTWTVRFTADPQLATEVLQNSTTDSSGCLGYTTDQGGATAVLNLNYSNIQQSPDRSLWLARFTVFQKVTYTTPDGETLTLTNTFHQQITGEQ